VSSTLSPAATPHPRQVTTTDAWKLAALTFVLIDHYGLFFDPEDVWWRLFGRIAAPVFFFLIGFARSRNVPWTWLAFGVLLTAVDYWTMPGRTSVTLNILLNFALLRLVLSWVETQVMPRPVPLAGLVLVSAALIAVLDPVLEYGGEGWLWALFGLGHRLYLDQPDRNALWRRNLLGAAAGAAYIVREISDYGFDAPQSAILVVLVGGLVLLLARFRRAALAWQPPGPVRGLFAFAGRHSLEIYAVSLLAMQLLAYAMDASDADEDEADGEDEDAG
jgi:hypothetical protein